MPPSESELIAMVNRTTARSTTRCGCRVEPDEHIDAASGFDYNPCRPLAKHPFPCGTDFPVGHLRLPTGTDRLESRSHRYPPAGGDGTTVIEDADGVHLALAPYSRPLRLDFDADADGLIDLFDWYALQTCYDRTSPRCRHLFDHDLSATVNAPDLDAFKLSAASAHAGPQAQRWRPSLTASRYGNPFMWTGQRFDATTGQYHFWARTYSPRQGRWMQRDPLEYIDGPNMLEYIRSAPLAATDQLGLQFPGPESRYWMKEEFKKVKFLPAPTPPYYPTVLVISEMGNIQTGRINQAVDLLAAVGYTSWPMNIHIEELRGSDGITSAFGGTVQIDTALVMSSNKTATGLLIDALLKDAALIDLAKTLAHENSHVHELFVHKLITIGYDGIFAYLAEIEALDRFLAFVQMNMWTDIITGRSVSYSRYYELLRVIVDRIQQATTRMHQEWEWSVLRDFLTPPVMPPDEYATCPPY